MPPRDPMESAAKVCTASGQPQLVPVTNVRSQKKLLHKVIMHIFSFFILKPSTRGISG